MKLSAWTSGARLLAALTLVSVVAGCGKKTPSQDGKGGATAAVTTKDEFNVAPGADPSVPAAMGGNGFEKIAADSGWQTGSLTPEQFSLVADTNAKKGGSISFALMEFPATFRQYGKDENSQTTRMINSLVYEPLIGTNPLTLEFLPSLASHWKVGADGQTYFFRIDPNARFSDGHPVTTEDVLATYKLAMDSTILSPFTNSFYAVRKRQLTCGDSTYDPTLTITTETRGSDVSIRIRDNGIGMPPAVIEKLFTPFFTTKPTGEGTGLGLSLSYDIVVHQHRGRFDVSSIENEHAEFTITLPRSVTAMSLGERRKT